MGRRGKSRIFGGARYLHDGSQYPGQVLGCNAEQIGFALAWTGLPQPVIIP
jgi:hypothetical protein